jgi:hypothetical protein
MESVGSRLYDPRPMEVIVTIIVAAITAALTSLVTPWAQWGVYKRRERTKRRVVVIEGARELVHKGQAMDRKEILLDARYLAIRTYLTPEAEGKLREQKLVAVRDTFGTTGNYYLAIIRDEADRAWGV